MLCCTVLLCCAMLCCSALHLPWSLMLCCAELGCWAGYLPCLPFTLLASPPHPQVQVGHS